MGMAPIKHDLNCIIESAVAALGFDFVGCDLVQSGGSTVLRVYVDTVNGIDIASIEKVSRQISAVLDVEEPLSNHYTLEVSSPGLDRRLFRLNDYHQFIGRSVSLALRVPKEGDNRRFYTGKLVSVDGQKIVLVMDSSENITFDFEEIHKANLVPEY